MEKSLSVYKEFYEAASEGNISKAAKKLNISQPAMSKAISRLENGLGTKLFDRTSKGVRLTVAGDVLYSYISDAFKYIEKGEQELKLITTLDQGHIKIGGSNDMCKYVLIPYLKDYIMNRPFSKITVYDHASNKILEKVQDGRLDIGVIASGRLPKGIEFIKLMDLHDILVSTSEYMRYVYKCFGKNVDIFKVANFMVLTKDDETRLYLEDYMKTNGIIMKRKLEITSMDLIIEFAKVHVGIGCVEKEFVRDELKNGILNEVPIKIPIPSRQVGIIYLKTNTNPELNEFLKCVV